MSKHSIIRPTAILAVLAIPLSAHAQSEEMQDMLSGLEAEGTLLDSGYADLDDDGQMEGFVSWSDGCESSVGCRWVIVDEVDGASEVRFTRFGGNPHLGADGLDRPSVIADGVPWRIGRTMMVPGESDYPGDLWAEAGDADLELLTSSTEYTDLSEMQVRVTMVDLNGDGFEERIMSVGGTYYAMMGGGFTPYTIHAGSGELLHSGYSADGPRIYRHDAGATVVEVTPAGINVKLLE